MKPRPLFVLGILLNETKVILFRIFLLFATLEAQDTVRNVLRKINIVQAVQDCDDLILKFTTLRDKLKDLEEYKKSHK